jgi:hypothetical protein
MACPETHIEQLTSFQIWMQGLEDEPEAPEQLSLFEEEKIQINETK